MTPQQIVGLASRLMAVWIAILSLQSFLVAEALYQRSEAGLASYTVAGVYLVFAALLWLFPMFIAHRLVPRTRFDDVLRLPVQQTVVVACIVLGLVVITMRALPGLAHYASLAIFVIGSGQTLSVMDPSQNLRGLVSLLELLVGLFLCFKASAIAHRLLPASAPPAATAAADDDLGD